MLKLQLHGDTSLAENEARSGLWWDFMAKKWLINGQQLWYKRTTNSFNCPLF